MRNRKSISFNYECLILIMNIFNINIIKSSCDL